MSVKDENRDHRSPGTEELLRSVLERALIVTKASGAAMALSDGRGMVCLAAQGTAPDLGTRLDAEFGFSGTCVRKCRILLCDDTETDPRVDRVACQRLGARSIVAVPLLHRGKAVGLFEIFSGSTHAFDDYDIRHLTLAAKMTVEAMAEMRSARRKRRLMA